MLEYLRHSDPLKGHCLLDWTSSGTTYGKLVHTVNWETRLLRAQEHLSVDFHDIISDEKCIKGRYTSLACVSLEPQKGLLQRMYIEKKQLQMLGIL